jgi:hypothetical protein
MKVYTAAPPDVLRCDEKNLREHSVFNCCGVIITTNYKTEGIYLPADDRRHYVAWSDSTKEEFTKKYWKDLWRWYLKKGGIEAVASYLMSLDISKFDAKAPPPKTPAFWAIVDANRAPEEGELTDVLERFGFPPAITLSQITDSIQFTYNDRGSFSEWLKDRKNRRIIPHRFEQCGYVSVPNPDRGTGMWVIDGIRQAVYVKKELTPREQLVAVAELRRQTDAARKSGKVIQMTPVQREKVKGNGEAKTPKF